MTVTFLHGVETDDVPSLPAPVPFNNYGVVGIAGTADDADDTVFPLTAGQSNSYAVANLSSIYIVGTNSTDAVAFTGN